MKRALLILLLLTLPAFGARELRYNTAVQVHIGPFVDVTDGFTPQTDITLAGNEAELLEANAGSPIDISGRTFTAISGCRGWYLLSLNTTDVDVLGPLTVVVQDDSDCLPVFCEFEVVSQQYYDAKYGSGYFDSDVVTWNGATDVVTNIDTIYDSIPFTVATMYSDALTQTTIANIIEGRLNEPVPADPNANSLWERIKTLDDAYTAAKAGYLTGDAFVRLGAPAGASIAADIANVAVGAVTISSTDIDNIVAAVDANVTPVLCSTTVSGAGTTTSFTIADGYATANAFMPGTLVIITDLDAPTDADGNRIGIARRIKSISAADLITLETGSSSDKPLPFTPANGDLVKIYANIAITRKGGV